MGVKLARALSNGVLLAVIETPTLFAKSANKGWAPEQFRNSLSRNSVQGSLSLALRGLSHFFA